MQNNNCDHQYQILVDEKSTVDQKYKAIFELRTINNQQAIHKLIDAFHLLNKQQFRSCLLLHEIAYALGQCDQQYQQLLTPFLIQVIEDNNQIDVVRHEAAEALANINQNQAIPLFEKYSKQDNQNDQCNILKDTCIIGLAKVQSYDQLKHLYGLQYMGTKEPAAPFEKMDQHPIDYILNDVNSLFNKYRALYYIRNNIKYFDRIGELLKSEKLGALFKHEICFVIGQVGEVPNNVHQTLIDIILDTNIPAIVRHEAIAAFQTVSTNAQDTIEFLKEQIKSQDQIVKETAIVSLELMGFYVQNI